jgi:hypothetical protein
MFSLHNLCLKGVQNGSVGVARWSTTPILPTHFNPDGLLYSVAYFDTPPRMIGYLALVCHRHKQSLSHVTDTSNRSAMSKTQAIGCTVLCRQSEEAGGRHRGQPSSVDIRVVQVEYLGGSPVRMGTAFGEAAIHCGLAGRSACV